MAETHDFGLPLSALARRKFHDEIIPAERLQLKPGPEMRAPVRGRKED